MSRTPLRLANSVRLPCRTAADTGRDSRPEPGRFYSAHTPRVPSVNAVGQKTLRGTTRGIETPSGFRDYVRAISHVAIAVMRGAVSEPAKLPLRRTFRCTQGAVISPYEHTSSGYPLRIQPFAVRLPVSDCSYCLKRYLAFRACRVELFTDAPFQHATGAATPRLHSSPNAGSLVPAHVERRELHLANPPNPMRGILTALRSPGLIQCFASDAVFQPRPRSRRLRIGYKAGITLLRNCKRITPTRLR